MGMIRIKENGKLLDEVVLVPLKPGEKMQLPQ
jgi:hypothetical protein